MNRKILVTGATGNTGGEVVRQLSAADTQFKAMVRDLGKTDNIKGVEWIAGTFDDKASLAKAFQGIDAIYVAMPPHPDNEKWIRNILDAAKESGVKQIVKLSGMGANADAGSEIIRVHARTDKLIIDSGIAYTILQPNSFFQNVFGSLQTIKDMGAIFLPLGDSMQSFIDIRDVAAVAVRALTQAGHENKVYKLSGPEPLSFNDIAGKLGKAIGKPVAYHPVSVEQAKAAMMQAGMPEWIADKLAEILGWFAKGGYEAVTSDVQQVLGRNPRSFDAFAADFKDAFK